MAAYLLNWNPKRTPFRSLANWSEEVKKGKTMEFQWSCGRRQQIQVGDRVFLIRLVKEPKGIFASGRVTNGSYQGKYWEPDKATAGKTAWYVDAKYHVLLDPEKDTILSRDRLNEPPFEGVAWSNQSSGIDIPDDIAVELEKALTNLSGTNPLDDLETQKNTYINLKETEREAVVQSRIGQGIFRSKLIKYWKASCAVTGCQREELLKSSHIKPWRDSNNHERLDVYNGLLLIPNLDSAFENGLISFDDDGKIIISKSLSKMEADKLGINTKMKISRFEKAHAKYLNYHRKRILRV